MHIQKEDTMGKVTIRNRNAGKFDKNGKRKAPNWEYRFETAPVDGKRRQKTNPDSAHSRKPMMPEMPPTLSTTLPAGSLNQRT